MNLKNFRYKYDEKNDISIILEKSINWDDWDGDSIVYSVFVESVKDGVRDGSVERFASLPEAGRYFELEVNLWVAKRVVRG